MRRAAAAFVAALCVAACLGAAACVGTARADAPPAHIAAASPQARARWLAMHDAYVSVARALKPHVVFLGDSLTFGWGVDGRDVWNEFYEPLGAVAFGIPGDRTDDLLWRLRHGELDGVDPHVVVLLIGSNDVGSGASAADTARGVQACLREIRTRAPHARVLLLGVLPRGPGGAETPIRREIAAVNAELATFADRKHVTMVDIGHAFLAPDGTLVTSFYVQDLLHLAEPGYRAWAQAMRPALEGALRG